MKRSNLLKAVLVLSILAQSSVVFASNETVLYDKDGIKVKLTQENEGDFIASVENSSTKDMFDVKLLSKDIKGLKIKNGSSLSIGTIKKGEKKVLDKTSLKFEIEKEIKKHVENQGLMQTGIKGVSKLLIPISIAGLSGVIYVLVKEKKYSKKTMSLVMALSIVGTSLIGYNNVNAKQEYDHIIDIKGDVEVKGKTYEYKGTLFWNDTEKAKEENKIVNKEEKKEEKKEENKEENKEEKKEETKEEKKEENKEENKEEKKEENTEEPILFKDEKLKEVLLNLFKTYNGNDKLSETIEGEYEFKLKDANYRVPKDAKELYKKDLEQIEALALRGFTTDNDYNIFSYEFKSIKGLESAKNLKQLTISSGIIPEESSEEFNNKIYYSKGSFSDLEPIKDLKSLELLRLSHNNIENISYLKDLPNLKKLYLSHNRITDISSLSELKNLESFDISKNNVVNISLVKNFKNLKTLAAMECNIDNLDFVKDLTDLEILNLGKNNISDISCLANLSKLKDVDISENHIKNFNAFERLKDIKMLSFDKQIINPNETFKCNKGKIEIQNPFNVSSVKKIDEKITVSTNNNDINVIFNETKNVFEITLSNDIIEKGPNIKFDLFFKFKNKIPFFNDYLESEFIYKDINLNLDFKNEEFVNIPDTKLLKVINKNLDENRPDDQKVTKKEMESLKEISIFLKYGKASFSENENNDDSNNFYSILGTPDKLDGADDFKFMVSRGIKNIQGLECAINLEKLKLNENEIQDISPLKNLKNLKYLEIQRNRITDISPLKDLTKLEFLKLYNNWITDISPLENLTNLTGLDVHYNVKKIKEGNKILSTGGITDISVLKNLKKLEFLDVSANKIENVDVILNFKKLKTIDFSGNNVRDYSKIYDFLSPMIKRQLMDEETGISVGFFGQTVRLNDEIELKENNISIKSPYIGIKDFNNSLKEKFSADELNLFSNIETDIKGVSAVYDVDKDEISFKFDKKFLYENNNKDIIVNLKMTYNEWQWNIENIKFKVRVEENFVVPKKYENFYKKAIGMKEKDKNFKDYKLTKEDMKKITKIEKMTGDITDEFLKPLMYADNLEKFEVALSSGKRIATDLYEITQKPKLKHFSYISNTEDGEKIDLNLNEFKSDILEDFRISKTNISSIEFLKNKNLKTLVVVDSKLNNLKDISNIKELERLEVSNNNIFSLGDLSSLSNLKTLYIKGNRISNISTLEKNKNLEALICDHCNISDISVLEKLPNLKRLHIDHNKLPENYMDTIRKLKKINTLGIDKISIDDFDFLKKNALRGGKNVSTDYDENEARSIDFKNLEIKVDIKKSDIKDGKITIDNKLKDFNEDFVTQLNNYTSEKRNLNDNISFKDDKIVIMINKSLQSILEKYPIEIESSNDYTYGGMPALISGMVTLNINIID